MEDVALFERQRRRPPAVLWETDPVRRASSRHQPFKRETRRA